MITVIEITVSSLKTVYGFFFCLLSSAFFIGVSLSLPLPSGWAQSADSTSKPNTSLQTEITNYDLAVMEHLIRIAQHNSPAIRDAQAAIGFAPFKDTISLEFSPSMTTTASNGPESPLYKEHSFSFTVTINPIQLVSAFEQQPALRSHLNEAKNQTRVTVVKAYIDYIKARQAVRIAAYQMQRLTTMTQVASSSSQSGQTKISHSVSQSEYVSTITAMLEANGNQRIALEVLAAAVGLPPHQTLAVIEGR